MCEDKRKVTWQKGRKGEFMLEAVQNLDWSILEWIQEVFKSDFSDFFFKNITVLGNAGIFWILMSIAMLFSKKYRKHGIAALVALILQLIIINLIVKNAVARSRPFTLDPSITLLLKAPTDYSFPSGHTFCSVIGAYMATRANWKFGLFAIPIAVMIAFSRLYLQVHFPSDVVSGAVMGLLLAVITLYVTNKVYLKRKTKDSVPEAAI